ncbi:hypothetical protein AB6A40_000443 [Gnathostoma spinigerum]|uniref:Thyroglobulin type-1 domain-containing protein n=1 Tax=Gnathostoma spinigerum TaxID=75299 RepID=A0ABD6E6H1_9BILA
MKSTPLLLLFIAFTSLLTTDVCCLSNRWRGRHRHSTRTAKLKNDENAPSNEATMNEEVNDGLRRNATESQGIHLKPKTKANIIAEIDDKIDCKTQRERIMDKHNNTPDSNVYIPTCAGKNDVLFNRIQCHRVSQFCWCVDEVSGVPIWGTSRLNASPDCDIDHEANKNHIHEIKGCTGRKKIKFYNRLLSSIETEMIIALSNNEFADILSSKEKAIRWKFRQLDLNQNSVLERREWKPYRKELKTWNKLRKCGRNFMRSCDVDGDRKITDAEWIDCTINVGTSVSRPKVSMRTNPFLDILKPDD